jgi:hypothetical protein
VSLRVARRQQQEYAERCVDANDHHQVMRMAVSLGPAQGPLTATSRARLVLRRRQASEQFIHRHADCQQPPVASGRAIELETDGRFA